MRTQITYVNLAVRSEAILGRKSTRKPISKISIRLSISFQVFLLGKTVGFCTDAPAGPSRQKRPLPYRDGDCPRLREAPESQRDEERHEENTRGIITIFQKPTLQRMSPPRGEREGTLNETRL
jgi:hypothetical protein